MFVGYPISGVSFTAISESDNRKGNMYPVYMTGEIPPPLDEDSLTEVTPTLKRQLFPNFFDSKKWVSSTL